MSVKAISAVWERSRAKGSNLLTLLAIADYAKDDGRDAWPSLATLAHKTRLTEKAIRYIIKKLQTDKEIEVEVNTADRAAKEGYAPELFIHVLCVSENFSKPVKFSDRSEQFSDQSENDGRAYKEDPSSDPSLDPSVRTYGDRRKKLSHRRHIYCGVNFCVPDFIHEQFTRQLGPARDQIELAGVEGWYASVDKGTNTPIPDALEYLRKKFREAIKDEFGDA